MRGVLLQRGRNPKVSWREGHKGGKLKRDGPQAAHVQSKSGHACSRARAQLEKRHHDNLHPLKKVSKTSDAPCIGWPLRF